ncbi:hypothetical protein [Actinosynnema sp. NPDC023587]|uniref:hypothetical protein n=1 Tax=Actinosynnema sp. NPDC023587 TaxID=3154695 RepID=UPI0033F3A654
MRALSRGVRGAAAGVALAALVGCATTAGTPVGSPVGGTSVVEQPSPTGLVGALRKVRATADSALMIEYGDVNAVRELTTSDAQRFRGLEGYGYSDLAPRSSLLGDAIGFDPRDAAEAIRVGKPPNWAGVLWTRVDVTLVNSKFERSGAKRADEAGATTWITANDGEVDLRSPFAQMGIVAGFNKVRVAPDSISFGTSGGSLAWVVEPGGSTLADDGSVAALASCLGEVVVALIVTGPSPVAVGVRAEDDRVDEVACAPSSAPADLRDRVQARLDDVTPARGPVWSTVLRDAEAEVPADRPGVVRVVVPAGPGTTAGRVFQAAQRNELAALFT